MASELPFKNLYPFQSRYFDVDGHKMHYVDEGSGPVIVFVHGNPTWSFYYRNLILALRPQYRTIAVDHIGCGLSDHPHTKHFKAVDRARHIELLLKHLGIKSFSLVMHDWGGPIGTFVAINNLAAVEKLVYFNTTLTETEILPWFIKISAARFPGKVITKTTRTFLKLATDVGVGKKLPKQVRAGYMYPYRTRGDRTAIWDFVQDIPFKESHPTYQRMLDISRAVPELAKKPIQIIWGLKDPCFHQEMLSHIMHLFPRARVLEFPNASHLVVEDETDVIVDTLTEFFGDRTAVVQGPSSEQVSPKEGNFNTTTLFNKFIKQTELRPNQYAAIVPHVWGRTITYKQITYADMKSLVSRYHRGLNTLGLRRGDKVLFLVKPGIDFLGLAYAVMAEGAIPVFIDPGIEKKYLFQALANIEADVFIGVQKAHLLRLLKKKLFKKVRFHVIADNWGITSGPTLTVLRRFASSPELPVNYNETAMVAFTSGATGTPKGVVFTQSMLDSQLRIFSEHFGMIPGGIDLPLLPIFSIYHLANGITSVFPPINPSAPLDLDPSVITKIIRDLSITSSFGSPTLWKKIAEYCSRIRITLPTLQRVFMAGAAVPLETVSLVKEAVVNGQVFTPYGATEALPVTKAPHAELQKNQTVYARTGEQGVFVGESIPEVEIRIIAESDLPISDIREAKFLGALEIGEILVKGPTVSRHYLNRPDADEIGKIKDGESFWHRMGDMGYLDERGGLYYCGRKVHVVRSPLGTFHSVPIEEIFNGHPKVARSALVELDNKEPAVVVEPLPSSWPEDPVHIEEFKEQLIEIAQKHSLTKNIEKFYFNRAFPVDRRHNAKIYRDRLGEWAREEEKSERRHNKQSRYGTN